MLKHAHTNRAVEGFTMLEVMIAIVITAFGLLGVAGLLSQMQISETEGFDRSQAMTLLWNMNERVYSAMPTTSAAAHAYTGGGTNTKVTVGAGNSTYTSPCTGTYAALDLCEWNFALQGAAETRAGASVGAMTGARGCVELIAAPNAAACTPATFRVSVVWQGLTDSVDQTANPNTCGKGQYGTEKRRRIVSEVITIGTPGCT